MEDNSYKSEDESLGTLFRKLRLDRSLDISEVAEETKIPPKTLRAMEADDYASLPANAFSRGFYSLYAKSLDLNPIEILDRFESERGGDSQIKGTESLSAPSWQGRNIGTMSERPSITPGSLIGLALLLVIIIAAVVSWYVGYNPATDISRWLRGFQSSPVPIERVEEQADDVGPKQQESTVETSTAEPAEQPTAVVNNSDNTTYQLVAEFVEAGNITISLDASPPQTMRFSEGSIEMWQAEKTISVEMDPNSKTQLYFNGAIIPLPQEKDGKITISLP
ncbi:MAG: helix-turn-helix domain-containing protein [Desulfobacterales bacterium]|nr:helix-turn-helix domain-containing protein [Deltaproteobacteria bacterium]NNK96759.1 helix-turn-helix domain-containing protein [Desulfobacterales bacterium]